MKELIKTKTAPIIRFLKKQKLISSLIICFVFFMIYFAVCGFNIISGNDDYCVFKVLYFGDVGIPCIGWFFTAFISLIQPFFGNLNSYMIIQEIICLGSLLTINYVFLSFLKGRNSLLLTVSFDIVCFSFIPFNILYSYTAIISCAAGLALLIYASVRESRKKFRVIQEVIAFLLIITGSQIRFAPLEALGAVFFAFALCALLVSFLRNRKNNSVGKALKKPFGKYLKTGVLIILAAAIALGAEVASNAIKHTSESYNETEDYYSALSAVNDYDDTSFYMDKEFYKSIGIKSISDYSVLRHWFIDEDFYTSDRLKTIADNSRKNNTLSNQKGIFESVFTPITTAFSEGWNSGVILIVAFGLIIFIFTIVVLCIFLDKSRAALMRFGSFVILWTFFFIVAKGFNVESMLAVPLAAITVYISFRYDNYMYLRALAVTLAVVGLYFYMITMRLYLHVTAAFLIPAFVLIVLSFEDSAAKSSDKKSPRSAAPVCVTASLLIVCSIVTAVVLFMDQPFAPTAKENAALKQYINENNDKTFLINQIATAKDYYEPFVLSEEPKNIVNYGLWLGKSGYMKSTRERNGIKNVYKDSIDSNVLIPLFEPKDKNGIVVSQYSKELGDYYSNHYAEKGETISLKFVERVKNYSIYKVVSEKTEKQKE